MEAQGLQTHHGTQNSRPSSRALLTFPSPSQVTLVFAQVTHTFPPFFAAVIPQQAQNTKEV